MWRQKVYKCKTKKNKNKIFWRVNIYLGGNVKYLRVNTSFSDHCGAWFAFLLYVHDFCPQAASPSPWWVCVQEMPSWWKTKISSWSLERKLWDIVPDSKDEVGFRGIFWEIYDHYSEVLWHLEKKLGTVHHLYQRAHWPSLGVKRGGAGVQKGWQVLGGQKGGAWGAKSVEPPKCTTRFDPLLGKKGGQNGWTIPHFISIRNKSF